MNCTMRVEVDMSAVANLKTQQSEKTARAESRKLMV